MYPRLVICGLIFTALISATPSPSPVTTPSSRRLCVYDNRFGLNYDPCAPFTSVHVTVLATFSTRVFGAWFEYDRRPVVALNDGSAIVAANIDGLFRIDRHNRVTILWGSNGRDYWYENGPLAPFSEGVVLYAEKSVFGVRIDGSLAFRKQVDTVNGRAENVTAAQDRDGTVWIADANGPQEVVYAYVPQRHRVEEVPSKLAQGKIIAAPDGRVYESARDGLFALSSAPSFRRRFVHAPITAAVSAARSVRNGWTFVAGRTSSRIGWIAVGSNVDASDSRASGREYPRDPPSPPYYAHHNAANELPSHYGARWSSVDFWVDPNYK